MAKLPMGQMAPTGGDTMGHFENQWANGPKSLVNRIPVEAITYINSIEAITYINSIEHLHKQY